jgi:hypothetical protein
MRIRRQIQIQLTLVSFSCGSGFYLSIDTNPCRSGSGTVYHMTFNEIDFASMQIIQTAGIFGKAIQVVSFLLFNSLLALDRLYRNRTQYIVVPTSVVHPDPADL